MSFIPSDYWLGQYLHLFHFKQTTTGARKRLIMFFLRPINWASLLFVGLAFWLYHRYPGATKIALESPKSIYDFTLKVHNIITVSHQRISSNHHLYSLPILWVSVFYLNRLSVCFCYKCGLFNFPKFCHRSNFMKSSQLGMGRETSQYPNQAPCRIWIFRCT